MRAEAIRLAGVKTVIRYYAHGPGQWDVKRCSTSASSMPWSAQNLSVAVVFQHQQQQGGDLRSARTRRSRMMWARTMLDWSCSSRGTPAIYLRRRLRPSCIRGQQDHEIQLGDHRPGGRSVRSYFEYAREELAKDGRKLGVYGCGRTCELLEASRIISGGRRRWTIGRAREFYNFRKWHLFQNRVDLDGYYDHPQACPIDAKPDQSGPRRFRPAGGAPARWTPIPGRGGAVLEARSFITVRRLGLYKDHPQRSRACCSTADTLDGERSARRFAMPSASNSDRGRRLLRLSLDEGDTVAADRHNERSQAVGAMPPKADRATPPRPRPAARPARRASRHHRGSAGRVDEPKVRCASRQAQSSREALALHDRVALSRIAGTARRRVDTPAARPTLRQFRGAPAGAG